MKIQAKRSLYFLLFIIVLLPKKINTQSDSVRVEYTEEKVENSNYKLKEGYKYLTRRMVEEKTLFKVGTAGLGFGGYYGLVISSKIALEQKLNPSFSILAEYKNKFHGHTYSIEGSWAFRYYYSMVKNIRKGVSENNFSANYISLQHDNSLSPTRERYLSSGRYYKEITKWRYRQQIALLWGIQRRLGQYGYFDINLGPTYGIGNSSGLGLDLNFSIGLGF